MADIRNNLNATTDPSAANDASQGYAVGSTWFNRNTAEEWRCANAQTGEAEWVLVSFDDQLWPLGHAHMPAGIVSWTDGQIVPNRLIMHKFVFRQKVRIEAIGVHVTTPQVGAAVRLGLYRHDRGTGWVGTRTRDAGELLLEPANTSPGDRKFINGLSIWLNPGIYFAAAVLTQSATGATVKRASGAVSGLHPRPKGQDLSTPGRFLMGNLDYGPLPATPPAMSFSHGTDGIGIMLAKG